MTCYSPLDGWMSANRNESGKRSVVFSLNQGLVDQPIQVPCGKCTGCRADQALMWSIRAYHESTLHFKNSFITLTYSDENLPPDGKLVKEDLQKFFKRLRKKYPPKHIRYIACGEYGDTTKRPHYHAIIFGEDFLHDKIQLTDDLYTQEDLANVWNLGHVSIAPVTMASICYVCGYVVKKIHDNDTFNLMSRRPGIGYNFLIQYYDDLVRTGSVTIEGREYPVPKRYLDWSPEEFKELKNARRKLAKSRDAAMHREGLRAREKNRKALLKQKKETL